MLDRDEEFHRKVMGVMKAASPRLTQMRVDGQDILVLANNGRRSRIPAATFYRMSAKEILSTVGVEANDSENL